VAGPGAATPVYVVTPAAPAPVRDAAAPLVLVATSPRLAGAGAAPVTGTPGPARPGGPASPDAGALFRSTGILTLDGRHGARPDDDAEDAPDVPADKNGPGGVPPGPVGSPTQIQPAGGVGHTVPAAGGEARGLTVFPDAGA